MSSQEHGLLDSIGSLFVPVHREGHKFIAVLAILTLLFFLLWSPLGWLFAILTLFVAYFFRDPDRVVPMREGLIISPADGKIHSIERVYPPSELNLGEGELMRISIVLSIFDVHINRAPVAGQITHAEYIPGAFVNATLDKSSEDNERSATVFTTRSGEEIGVVQIAGFIARRIITFKKIGRTVGVGERFGLIRFGSRVDVYLPSGHNALVSVGQTTIAGETVLADLKSDEAEREARET